MAEVVVTAKALGEYRNALKTISEDAAQEIQKYMLDHKFLIDDAFIEYAYEIATTYGEAAAALSCDFYEGLQTYWAEVNAGGAPYRNAMPAETATFGDVAKTVNGAKKQGLAEIPGAVGRLVKRTAEDTTLKNAIKNGDEFAWIPAGDTCAFCIMLASNGWQKPSKNALKNGHAEHIHANCDCTYSVRFGKNMDFQGYDPDKYKELYDDAEGRTWQDKLNSMRREFYEENKDEINAQKRSAYEKRKEREASQAEEKNVGEG